MQPSERRARRAASVHLGHESAGVGRAGLELMQSTECGRFVFISVSVSGYGTLFHLSHPPHLFMEKKDYAV